jgi:hypothetical protein
MIGPPDYKAAVEGWASAAMSEARQRIAEWSKPVERIGVNVREQLALIAECDYRGPIVKPRCGCQGEWRLCGMRRGDPPNEEQVRLSHCLMCVKGQS